MMKTSAATILMLTVGVLGCQTVDREQSAVDANWSRFVSVASRTTVNNYSETDRGQSRFTALESLGLTNQVWLHNPILVAAGDRSHVSVTPIPAVCKADSQVLLAAGDVTGDGAPEFIFAAGWWGPMAGVLAVYDQDLGQIARLNTGCIWAVAVQRYSQNGPRIVCCEDEHPGNGVFNRYTRVYRYVAGAGLVREKDELETASNGTEPIR
jgi:hypothetical protein